ncbi:response regulator transcription factor [Streptomyces sp. 11-1-2]|uniref:response regulator transcription factor n=1 Tax=unclassified Streptomyces TaxID=2593676 RepID=UPI000B8D7725|nr:response regulator transcription factor [Streptomyces sp. 11-1-2]ASQ98498.1 DNA-binding response regulator [Streptomyces sp. 11-1-2]
MTVRALLIEDDETIAEPLVEGLGRYGLMVGHVGTGAAGLEGPYGDIVLLDLGLPDMDGIDVCRGIRQVSDVPIIMLTARGEEADRVLGLELGADDYLAKPFSMRELIARIRAVTRRSQRTATATATDPALTATAPAAPTAPAAAPAATAPATAQPPPWEQEPLVVDRRTRQVWVGGAPVTLTPKEFELLALLTEDPGAVYSRQQILDRVWDPHFHGPTKTLDVHVATLRRKLGDPAWIQTLRGVGFRLAVHSGAPSGVPSGVPGVPEAARP